VTGFRRLNWAIAGVGTAAGAGLFAGWPLAAAAAPAVVLWVVGAVRYAKLSFLFQTLLAGKPQPAAGTVDPSAPAERPAPRCSICGGRLQIRLTGTGPRCPICDSGTAPPSIPV
jgi:hypothetical protein